MSEAIPPKDVIRILEVLEAVTLIPKLPNYAPTMLGILLLGIGLYSSRADIATHWNERIPPALEDWESYLYQFPDARRLESEKIVSRLKDNAILFTNWDYAYDFYYVAHVLQGRTAMDFHETFPQDGVTQLADSTLTISKRILIRVPSISRNAHHI